MSKHEERLQKVIAQSGWTSRRKAEQLIADGKVKVNDKTVTEMGIKVTHADKVEVDGVPIEKEEFVYYLLYKPRGVISSVKDDKDRKVVTDYLPEVNERVFPVGRLDYDTSGILLLTNDGEFANQLMHPSKEVNKLYVAKVKGIPHKKELSKFRKGIVSDGEKLKADHAHMLSSNKEKQTSIIEIALHEGKNRQVRRMLDAIDLPVIKLKREQYGFLTLHGLNAGEYRALTPKEVNQLRNMSAKL